MRIGVAGVRRIGACHARPLSSINDIDTLVLADTIPARAADVAAELGAEQLPGPNDLFGACTDGARIDEVRA